ncbi:MAG: flagellar hook-length control protein FliK [Clostridiales bacterium]|nr:flagellar hook-length control protein FliK [Clostridiales bacterium]
MEITVNLGSILKREHQNIQANESVKGSESMTKGERLYRLQNEIRSLQPGQTLQGTVIGRNGSTVQVALNQELTINARIDQGINLTMGQLMSFEVKANSGSLLSLTPLYTNTANVETIRQALLAAGLQETADNMEMVAVMMEEGMSIDKESVLDMGRQLMEFPNQNPVSVIQMARLELPITETTIEQFEQYSNANHQILGSVETIMNELPEVFTELMDEGGTQQAAAFYQSVLEIFTEGQEGLVLLQEPSGQEPVSGEAAQPVMEQGVLGQAADSAQEPLPAASEQPAEAGGLRGGALPTDYGAGEPPVLTKQQWNTLGDLLREAGVEETQAGQVQNGETAPGEVLNLIRGLLAGEETGKALSHELGRVLGSEEFQILLKSEVQKQWLIQPESVAEPEKVKQLYERIRQQSARLQEALQTAGKNDAPAAKSIQNLQNNVDFMNKMNHVFTYVQLPLKMEGNNAHGDLYIYTNKKNLAAKDGNVSALLHLDMEHLGAMDVYVTMQNQRVNTNFTLQDESALDLIEQNIALLDERLARRGYDLQTQFQLKEAEADKEGAGIMRTILNQDKNISVLSRTSFDMRA